MSKIARYMAILMVVVAASCSADKEQPETVSGEGVVVEGADQAVTDGSGGTQVDAEATQWLTDFEAAKKLSAQTGRPILADFSGSDWCGWCIKLDKEVFSQPAFKAYAKDNVILFLADFPSRKQLPEATKAQNEALSEKYGIKGFPTVLLLDAEGKVLATTGYQRGGPEAYVAHLKELMDGKK